jgi:hypothetical protein
MPYFVLTPFFDALDALVSPLERVLKSFFPPIVIPANAGIQRFDLRLLDSRRRGNDGGLSFKTHSYRAINGLRTIKQVTGIFRSDPF